MNQENENEVKDQQNEEKGEQQAERQEKIEVPPVTFENFLFNLYSTAYMYLGVRDPESGKLIQNLPLARHAIDTIAMIQEKTKGNLTLPETNLIENLLYELRMNYVRIVKIAEETAKTKPETGEAESDIPPKESEVQNSQPQDSEPKRG